MSQKYVVRQGDCLSSIAAHFGLPNWHVIYDAPDNKDFKKKRPNPNIIYPGDEVVIPDTQPGNQSIATGSTHTFQVTLPLTNLKIKVFDDIGEKPTKANYELRILGLPEPITGALANGLVDTKIPPWARRGNLVITSTEDGSIIEQVELQLGGLDPVDTISGAQMRLQQLGFDCGPITGDMTPATEGAIRTFQRVYKLTEDGTLSAVTQDKLKEIYGI
jgi:hypothetical protein